MLAAACGGGDDAPTDQDYADEIEAIEDDYADATEGLDSDGDAIIDDLDGFGDFGDALTERAEGYSDLEAPAPISSEHDDYADALTTTAAAATDAFERADDAGSEDEAQEEIDYFFASDEVDESGEACAALQEAADDEEIAADYRCDGTRRTGAGDDGIDPAEYAARVNEIEEDFAGSVSADIEDPVEQYAQITGALHDYITAYANLPPPEVLRELHEEYVAAGKEILDESEGILAEAEGAGNREEAQRIIDDFRNTITPADERFSEACEVIQSAADDEDIPADYRCPGS
jgi:hypothetical protein